METEMKIAVQILGPDELKKLTDAAKVAEILTELSSLGFAYEISGNSYAYMRGERTYRVTIKKHKPYDIQERDNDPLEITAGATTQLGVLTRVVKLARRWAESYKEA